MPGRRMRLKAGDKPTEGPANLHTGRERVQDREGDVHLFPNGGLPHTGQSKDQKSQQLDCLPAFFLPGFSPFAPEG